MKEPLEELTFDFDYNYGGLDLRIHTLNNISRELMEIACDIEETDRSTMESMGMKFCDIGYKVELLAELLRYTMDDLNVELKKTRSIKESYFDIIVRQSNEKETTPDPEENQG